ncbi:NAD(P)-binding protein [Daedaleopsis nitida]|nr:NAD(P)-binding protein [Daedaleopsis nitida]
MTLQQDRVLIKKPGGHPILVRHVVCTDVHQPISFKSPTTFNLAMSATGTDAHIAIVTGAAQGIGEAIALRLAEDGYDVAVNDLPSSADKIASVVSAIQAKGRKAIAIPGDVSVEADVAGMVQKTVELLGGLDVMVANAGILKVHSVFEITVEDWDRVMAVNTRSVMLCYKHAGRHMVKQGRGGRLIGACSTAGKTGLGFLPAYSASKFAVRGLTQAAALELAEHQITVNCYAPGAIATGMTLADGEKIVGLRQTAVAHPAVIAGLVSYLAKPEAHFVTGQTINVNGGSVVD